MTEKKTPRARRREKRIKEILETAMRIVLEEGVDAMTIHRLARELDYTAGALYRYFPSKQALMVELQRQSLGYLRDHFAAAGGIVDDFWSKQHSADADQHLVKLLGWVQVYVDLQGNVPAQAALLHVAIADPKRLVEPEHVGPVVQVAYELLRQIFDALERAQNAGALSEGVASYRGVELWLALHGVLLSRKLAQWSDAFDESMLSSTLACDLLVSWGAKREQVDASKRWLEEVTEEKRLGQLAIDQIGRWTV